MKKTELALMVAYFVGIALIITGQSVYRYAAQRISDLEARPSPSLSQEEYGNIRFLGLVATSSSILQCTDFILSCDLRNRFIDFLDCVCYFENIGKQINKIYARVGFKS